MAPPSATPKPADRSGPGCLVALIALPVVILLGIVVGTMLNRPDDPPEEERTTLDAGAVGEVQWRVEAIRDVEGEVCTFLYEDGEQLTGACTEDPQDATFGDQTVVFGRIDGTGAAVDVELSDGEVVEIPTREVDGLDGRFYVQVLAGDLDAVALR